MYKGGFMGKEIGLKWFLTILHLSILEIMIR